MSSPRVALVLSACVVSGLSGAGAAEGPVLALANDYARIAINAAGQNAGLVATQSGKDYARLTPPSPCARVTRGNQQYEVTQASYADGVLTLVFAGAEASARLKVTALPHYFVVEVVGVTGAPLDSLVFVDLPLTLQGAPQETFAACALALNLQTRVQGIPQATSHLWAACYPRFGVVGARVALIACPTAELRRVMQEAVSAAPELPHSPLGGPWALDARDNYGSYLFNFGGLTEDTVDSWIELAHSLGITQIDFHGGSSFRFGDCRPDPTMYPRGVASLKAVIDKLHAAGILAGLHTYAMFMSTSCPWVTPVPDPRLGKDAIFTLAGDLPADAVAVPVIESTATMSTITGFFVRNSVTLQIDDELITYAGVAKEAPFAFTQCQRGAFGTRVAAHPKGAPVQHLRQCFGLFVPDGDSTLFAEAAAKTAELYNAAGFDMIYLDALDGGDTVAGAEYSWHYESKFTFEIWKRLQRPAIMEMSTFHHHLWYVRSRGGAWDHPNRSHKRFIDLHCRANDVLRQQFLPGHLGWWAFKTWQGAPGEPTFPDDIEYLCGKALGTGNGLSILGIDPANRHAVAALPRLASIVRRYEGLRRAGYFSDAVREKLRVPGAEFSLFQGEDGEWQFRPLSYVPHVVQMRDRASSTWRVHNPGGRQALQLRLEALQSAGPYEDPAQLTLADFSDPAQFPERAAQPGISATLETSTAQLQVGPVSGLLTASNATDSATRSWCKLGRRYAPPLDLSGQQALGLWVYGDGRGEVLNLQQTSPSQQSNGIADHYVTIDFTGWRYIELVEPEGERYAAHSWPYGDAYSIYRECILPGSVETLSIWLNNLPPKGSVSCFLSPIRALPVLAGKLRQPALTVNGTTITFPVEIESGQYLELRAGGECVLCGSKGEELARLQPVGEVPQLESGDNELSFSCAAVAADPAPRAKLTTITQAEPLRGVSQHDQVRWELLRREDDEPRTITALDGVQNQWDVVCRPDAKAARLDAEVVVEAVGQPGAMYSDPSALALETFDRLDAFADGPGNRYLQYVESGALKGVATAPGVTHELGLATDVVKQGPSSGRYTATSQAAGGWSARGRRFDPPLDLSTCTHLGFPVYGDGNGEVLYLQLRDTQGAWHDLKVGIGFSGWKYREFSLVGAACNLAQIEYLIIYYNDLPAGKTCTCYLDDIRAWHDPTFLRHPSLSSGGRQLVFPAMIQPGERLVCRGEEDSLLYDAEGKLRAQVKPSGAALALQPGRNRLTFGLEAGGAKAFRVRVTTTKVYE